jgi:prepilin-type N-terminal cleavage/methylation domain-containing protein
MKNRRLLISIGYLDFTHLRSCIGKKQDKKGFTLVELMAVIMIVSILAAVAVSIMRGRVDSAKWSEASAAAGTIRTAVSGYVALYDISKAKSDLVNGGLDNPTIQSALGFITSDLTGTYFVPSDYTIVDIDSYGRATIEVNGSRENAPEGTKTLDTDGNWL